MKISKSIIIAILLIICFLGKVYIVSATRESYTHYSRNNDKNSEKKDDIKSARQNEKTSESQAYSVYMQSQSIIKRLYLDNEQERRVYNSMINSRDLVSVRRVMNKQLEDFEKKNQQEVKQLVDHKIQNLRNQFSNLNISSNKEIIQEIFLKKYRCCIALFSSDSRVISEVENDMIRIVRLMKKNNAEEIGESSVKKLYDQFTKSNFNSSNQDVTISYATRIENYFSEQFKNYSQILEKQCAFAEASKDTLNFIKLIKKKKHFFENSNKDINSNNKNQQSEFTNKKEKSCDDEDDDGYSYYSGDGSTYYDFSEYDNPFSGESQKKYKQNKEFTELIEAIFEEEKFNYLSLGKKKSAVQLFRTFLKQEELDEMDKNYEKLKHGHTHLLEGDIFDSAHHDIDEQIAIASGEEDEAKMIEFWSKVTYGNGKKQANEYAVGFKNTAYGISSGLNVHINDSLLIAIAYSLKDINYEYREARLGDKTNVRAHIFSLSGRYKINPYWSIQPKFSFAVSHLNSARNIKNAYQNLIARSDPKNHMFNFSLYTNYDFYIDKLKLIPTIGLEYYNTKIGGYVEKGASFHNMSMNSHKRETLFAKVGANISLPDMLSSLEDSKNFNNVILTPSIYFDLKYRVAQKKPVIYTKFVWSEENSYVKSYDTHNIEYNVGGSLSVKMKDSLECTVKYTTHIHKKYNFNEGSIGIKFLL